MIGHEVLEYWWSVPACLALLGYGRSLAGVTRAQRAVWVKARIVEVGRPAHGASQKPGIPVTLAFQDPSTGREFTLAHAGEHGAAIEVAWVGREVEVRYPPGQPLRFAVVLDADGEKSGRMGPDCAVMLLLIGLVIHATVRWGHPAALLGFGALAAAAALRSPDIRLVRARNALLDSAVAVPARVVAVTKDVYVDPDSGENVSHAPVVTFTTRDGTDVTVLSRTGIRDPGRSLHRDLTIHYAPTDPAVHTPDLAADRRSGARAVAFIVVLLLAGVAAAVVGAVRLT
ncbi:DUF3592 domain-containing protein [Streptomyces sp. SID13726]|uniref:DUF3592 domain-containing protein n=1 Tax=Streptomyces sp. SID13726 TaxID=2706058 RepID=UPI0013BBD7E4|nr:DUF3592 domain-containing protein [Streptomyces sp. SID13726]NEA97707.1 DUF3592 domain-containing protein [Streptomyces sp. SID13726]